MLKKWLRKSLYSPLPQFIFVIVWFSIKSMATCPNACECKWKNGKETVSCHGAAFIDIPRGLDPSTQVLDLENNNLKILPTNSFLDTGLVNLQKVWMTNCNLKQIQEGAFRFLANLIELDLSFNFLRTIPSRAFIDISRLQELKIANNSLSKISDAAFAFLPDLLKLDLSFNKIYVVSDNAFASLSKLEVLRLTGNQLKSLPSDAMEPLISLHGFHVQHNPWHCDCRLRPLRQWMMSRGIPTVVAPTCNLPQRLQGMAWPNLQIDEFVCKPQVTAVDHKVLASYGDNVSLACLVKTDLDADVTWLLDGRPVANTTVASIEKFRVLELVAPNRGARLSNLTIARAGLEDQGIYKCVAENKAGRMETNVTLKVLEVILDIPEKEISDILIMCILLGGSGFTIISFIIVCTVLYHRKRRSLCDEPSPIITHIPSLFVKEQSTTKGQNVDRIDYQKVASIKKTNTLRQSFEKHSVIPVSIACNRKCGHNRDVKISENCEVYSFKLPKPDTLRRQDDIFSSCGKKRASCHTIHRHNLSTAHCHRGRHPVQCTPHYCTMPRSSKSATDLTCKLEDHVCFALKRHPSLPTSSLFPLQSFDLPVEENCRCSSNQPEIAWYEYHAKQLEIYLEEYKHLQEHLSKMKSSCPAHSKVPVGCSSAIHAC